MDVIYYFRKDIVMKCRYCEKEFESKRSTRQFCSHRCQVAWHRKVSVTGTTKQKLVSVTEPDESVTVNPVTVTSNVTVREDSVTKLSREELYKRIHRYPGNTWKDSPEYAELIHRLKTTPLSELEAKGYQIPNWKAHELPCPIRLNAS